MKLAFRYLCLLYAAVLFVSAESYADDRCDAILQHGIYNTTSTESDQMHFRALLNWLSQSTFSSWADASDTAGKLGIVIDDLPITLGISNRTQNWHDYQAQLQTLSSDQEYYRSHFSQRIQEIDHEIIKAWKGCTESAPGVVHAVAKQNYDPAKFIVELIYQPVGDPPSAKITSWTVQPASVKCSPTIWTSWYWHDYINSSGIILNCSRTPSESVQITGNTAKGTLSAQLPGIVPPAPQQATPPPAKLYVPHHNNPQIQFRVAFDNRLGEDTYVSGAWTKMQGIETINPDFNPTFGDLRFSFMCHMEGKGDQPASAYTGPDNKPNVGSWYQSGQPCGVQRQGLHLEGFGMVLAGAAAPFYDVQYSCQSAGESSPRSGSNGTYCGTRNENKQLQKAVVTVTCKPEFCEQP